MNTPSDHNPYSPPKANVSPAATEQQGEFIEGGQPVPASNALAWIGGWAMFVKAPGVWILNVCLFLVVTLFVAAVPLLGSIAVNLLMPILIGGIMLGCKSLDEGNGLQVQHLFEGFKDKGGRLAMIGLLMFAYTFVIIMAVVIVMVIMFGAALLHVMSDQQAISSFLAERGILVFLLLVLVAVALMIPLTMAFWFAPALVVFHDLDAVQAMKQSFKACLRNILPFLLYGIVYFVLMIVAMIPLLLGLLVIGPVGYGSLYASYKDIFLKR
jgi:uncharacterized membrane protein